MAKLLYIGCTLIVCLASAAYAGGRETNEFENMYQPNHREICEMYASASILEKFPECKSVSLFKPIVDTKLAVSESPKVEISKDKFPSWPLDYAYFDFNVTDKDKINPIFHIGNLGDFELGDIVSQFRPIKSIAIGNIQDVIILEVRAGEYRQIIFTPYSCLGHDGYGDETLYQISQVFSWHPNFPNEAYEKTFYSPPLCN